jgi:hypothetical protein
MDVTMIFFGADRGAIPLANLRAPTSNNGPFIQPLKLLIGLINKLQDVWAPRSPMLLTGNWCCELLSLGELCNGPTAIPASNLTPHLVSHIAPLRDALANRMSSSPGLPSKIITTLYHVYM